MEKIKLIISYKGTSFYGFQRQKNLRTVQGELENALYTVLNHKVTIVGAGRTDAGVHASGQVVSFETDKNIPEKAYVNILNNILPQDLSVIDSQIVEKDFSARFSAKQKSYEYKMYISKVRLPLIDEFCLQVPYSINIEKMNEACKHLIGTKDFACFMSSGVVVKDTIRTIYSCSLSKNDNVVSFNITGRSFLYNMVRNIVGVLLRVGDGTLQPDDVEKLIESKTRVKTKMASAKGLTLVSVEY